MQRGHPEQRPGPALLPALGSARDAGGKKWGGNVVGRGPERSERQRMENQRSGDLSGGVAAMEGLRVRGSRSGARSRRCWRRWVDGGHAAEVWRGPPGTTAWGHPGVRHHRLSPVGSPEVPAITAGSAHVAEQDKGAGAEQRSRPLHAEQEGWATASSPSALRISRAVPAGVVALPGCGHFPHPHPGLCWM